MLSVFLIMRFRYLTYFLLAVLFLAACQTGTGVVEVTREVEVTRPVLFEREIEVTRLVEVTREVEVAAEDSSEGQESGEFGSADRPFRVVFLPGNPAALIDVRGGFLIEFLAEETGYQFEAVAPTSDEEAIDELCRRPQETIAVLIPEAYVAAVARCEVQLTHAATRFDVPYQLGMLVARQDRVINVIEDLAFKTVGVPGLDDLATYLWFAADLEEREIEPAEFVVLESSSAALLAVLREEVDVAAAIYNPPVLPREERIWEYGVDAPEVWRQIEIEPERDPVGYVDVAGGPEFGGYRIRDARAALFDDFPEIFAETRIVALSAPIPNEAVVISRDFPYAAAQKIIPALEQFANSEMCGQSVCASDFYQWDGIQPVVDSFYDVWRMEEESAEDDPEDSDS